MGKGNRNRNRKRKKPNDVNNSSPQPLLPPQPPLPPLPADSSEESGSPRRKNAKDSVRSRSERSLSESGDSSTDTDSSSSSEYSEVAEEEQTEQRGVAASSRAATKLPPIMVKNFSLNRLQRELESRKVTAEYKLCQTGTKITAASREHWDSIVNYLKERKAE